MISRDIFESQVKDLLDHFYDPAYLQTHPLVETLLPEEATEETRGQGLRELVLQALDRLRPDSSVPYGRAEWLPYRVLWLRYIECQAAADVCTELNIGRTSYYRHLNEMLEALVSILWGGYRENSQDREKAQPVTDLAIEEAVKLARSAQREPVQLGEILESALSTIQPLARQRQVKIVAGLAPALPITFADPSLLRQILINALAEGIEQGASKALGLTLQMGAGEVYYRLSPLTSNDKPDRFKVSETLLTTLGGRLWLERRSDGSSMLCFTIPVVHPKTILAIDNDPDTIELYRRYLQPRGYHLRTAFSGEEARAILAEGRPDLVLLDMLMPQEDGWNILQQLKANAKTADVPVIICSVLDQPHLALALGATEVLKKPIDQAILISAIRRSLGEKHT